MATIDLRHRSRRNAIRRRTCVRSLRRIGSPCRTGGETYYPLTDVQGTIWGYADANNAIVARFEYDAWGNILSATSSIPALARNRYRFQCREWSAATGLVNFRARWYDPVTGRWLSKDPIGLSGGLNLYAFCGNDPVNWKDKFGLCSKKGNAEVEKARIRSLRSGDDTSLVFDVLLAYNLHSGGGPMDYSARPRPNMWQLGDGTTLNLKIAVEGNDVFARQLKLAG